MTTSPLSRAIFAPMGVFLLLVLYANCIFADYTTSHKIQSSKHPYTLRARKKSPTPQEYNLRPRSPSGVCSQNPRLYHKTFLQFLIDRNELKNYQDSHNIEGMSPYRSMLRFEYYEELIPHLKRLLDESKSPTIYHGATSINKLLTALQEIHSLAEIVFPEELGGSSSSLGSHRHSFCEKVTNCLKERPEMPTPFKKAHIEESYDRNGRPVPNGTKNSLRPDFRLSPNKEKGRPAIVVDHKFLSTRHIGKKKRRSIMSSSQAKAYYETFLSSGDNSSECSLDSDTDLGFDSDSDPGKENLFIIANMQH